LLPTLVINLDRSKERWAEIAASAVGTGLELRRVAAVDGAEIPAELRHGLDHQKFCFSNGREVLPGEYGCYRSHLDALRMVVDEGHDLAIIGEDDISLNRELRDRVLAIFEALPTIDVLKLVNHRTRGFVRYGASSLGDAFGRCLHGPQGSAACYAVTRKGAGLLLASLEPMWLPYDIALERGWATGASTFTTHHPLVEFGSNREDTLIATRQQYHDVKMPRIKRAGTLISRGTDYFARAFYGIKRT
jgi:glycosyl transferase family 25